MTTSESSMRGGGLKELRRAAGFSQEGLARTAECSLSMVRLLEAGYRPRSSEVLDRIAAALTQPGGRAEPIRSLANTTSIVGTPSACRSTIASAPPQTAGRG